MRKVVSLQSGRKPEEQPQLRNLVPWQGVQISTTGRHHQTIQKFVEKKLKPLPRNVQTHLLNNYKYKFESKTAKNPERAANIGLRKSAKMLNQAIAASPFDNANVLNNQQKLEALARENAQECYETVIRYSGKGEFKQNLFSVADDIYTLAKQWQLEHHYDPFKRDEDAALSFIAHMCSESWWQSKVKRARDFLIEYLAISAGFVRKGMNEYVSNQCLSEFEQSLKASERYLNAMEVVNKETGEAIALSDIASKTTANPELRRVELMVRCRGAENLADEMGYESLFITITAPSKYHRVKGDSWNGATPRKTHKYLCSQWAKMRAALDRENIHRFGIRVTEPHADATPHWHLLLFAHSKDIQAVKRIVDKYALEHDRHEKGAEEKRYEIEHIDRSKGSATGYIAKYISKNVNGSNMANEPDFNGTGSVSQAVNRVTAWARRWRIRQFQPFGLAPVSVYRELRRIKDKSPIEGLEKVRLAADAAKWDSFTKLLEENPVELAYQEAENQYGETVKKISGVKLFGDLLETRVIPFELRRRRGGSSSNGDSRSWSSVNNCTEYSDSENVQRIKQSTGLDRILSGALARGFRVKDSLGRNHQIKNGAIVTETPPISAKTSNLDDKILAFERLRAEVYSEPLDDS